MLATAKPRLLTYSVSDLTPTIHTPGEVKRDVLNPSATKFSPGKTSAKIPCSSTANSCSEANLDTGVKTNLSLKSKSFFSKSAVSGSEGSDSPKVSSLSTSSRQYKPYRELSEQSLYRQIKEMKPRKKRRCNYDRAKFCVAPKF